jgi:hypothetical protein
MVYLPARRRVCRFQEVDRHRQDGSAARPVAVTGDLSEAVRQSRRTPRRPAGGMTPKSASSPWAKKAQQSPRSGQRTRRPALASGPSPHSARRFPAPRGLAAQLLPSPLPILRVVASVYPSSLATLAKACRRPCNVSPCSADSRARMRSHALGSPPKAPSHLSPSNTSSLMLLPRNFRITSKAGLPIGRMLSASLLSTRRKHRPRWSTSSVRSPATSPRRRARQDEAV